VIRPAPARSGPCPGRVRPPARHRPRPPRSFPRARARVPLAIPGLGTPYRPGGGYTSFGACLYASPEHRARLNLPRFDMSKTLSDVIKYGFIHLKQTRLTMVLLRDGQWLRPLPGPATEQGMVQLNERPKVSNPERSADLDKSRNTRTNETCSQASGTTVDEKGSLVRVRVATAATAQPAPSPDTSVLRRDFSISAGITAQMRGRFANFI
jgi:hypothetical protein